MNIGVIGFGYWGPNIVRNFLHHPECEVKCICDFEAGARKRATDMYSKINVTDNVEDIFKDESLDIVAVVTPVSTHYQLAKSALLANKHVFLEKPMVETTEQANDLIRIAKANNLIGIVDHTFLFTGAVMKIKEIIDSGEIGDITYFDSVRVNLGLFQHDVDVIWDLAPHDLSILFYLCSERPISLIATGVDHINNGLVDVAYLTLGYNSKMIANFHTNWLSPVKVRKILIGGTKKMIVFDDMIASEKVKVYDKGITVSKPEDIYRLLVKYRSGDMEAPVISPTEALMLEVNTFIDQIQEQKTLSINDFTKGKDVVQILEASSQSLETGERVLL